ncbi:hypothetical protein [Cupriavidus campinensis]
MVLTTDLPVHRRRAGSAAAMALLGAGLACAGSAYASGELPAAATAIDIAMNATPDTSDVAVAHAVDLPSLPAPVELAEAPASASIEVIDDLRAKEAPVATARGRMAKWKPVAQARLDEKRGGFDVGGLQVSFGIDRAVFVNGALAVSTSINIPDVSRITAAQAQQLAAALSGVTSAVTAANSAAAAAQGAAANAQGAAGAAGQSATDAAQGGNASAQGAAGLASQTIATSTGTVTTNGLLSVVQNGAGNTANVGAMANMPGTVIQNTLNNQSIQSLMTINASVNTLAAFRAQMANTALNSVIQRTAAMR